MDGVVRCCSHCAGCVCFADRGRGGEIYELILTIAPPIQDKNATTGQTRGTSIEKMDTDKFFCAVKMVPHSIHVDNV